MATYAAYRHIELDKIGYGKKRVLKPPGGGSSDIFGCDSADGFVPRRNARAHEGSLSQVLQQPEEANPTPSKPRVDSHSRLFGPPTQSLSTPSKNRMKSNIPIGETAVNGHAENGHVNGDTTDTDSMSSRSPENGFSNRFVLRSQIRSQRPSQRPSYKRPDGNPVTGNGYAEYSHNGHGVDSNGHRRIPPGGFSSGLW